MKINYKITRKILTAVLIIALCAFLLTGCGSKTDAMEYVSVNFTGYNGNGEVDLDVDYDAMIEAVIGEEPDSDNYEKFSKWMNEYLIYDEGIKVSCSPKDGLSNGDTVTVKVTLSETAAKKIAGGEKKFTVSGLPEIEIVDLFKDVSLRYEGIVGEYTMVHLDKLSDSQILQDCNFRVEPQSSIKNGDVVTVTITNAETLAEKHLCAPAETSKTFTVSGLDEYLTDSDLLPEEKIREIIEQFVPACRKEDDSIFTHSEPAYYKTYFCIGKEAVIGADFNRLYIYVCYDQYMDGNYRWTVYTPLTFRNLVLTADGSIDLEYENGENAVFQTSPESVVEHMEELYTVDEVYVEY